MTGPLPTEDFNLEEMLATLHEWVRLESPTFDRAGVNRMMDAATAAVTALGAKVDRLPGRQGFGDALTARLPGKHEGPGILVLAHLDTVHPVGSVDGRSAPLARDGHFYGPGAYDMKGGAVAALYALKKVIERDGGTPLPITLLFTPDEEVGSPVSRELIEAEAKKSRFVLIPEPAREGNVVTGRWGFQRFTVRARGRAAHAGATLAQGRSAIREIAHQVVAIESMSEPAKDVTLSVGTIHGGTFVNVVPVECAAELLAVTPTQAQFDELRERMLALEAIDPDIDLIVEPGPVRPLFEPTESVERLYRHALGLAREIGFEPKQVIVGGGSDGNFTGALGVPTLDGLGLCGDGAHTTEERVIISSIVPRSRLFSGLLRTLGDAQL